MVTQARDQLRSNETLDDLRAVFEGSCALIPIKLVRKECDKLVDDFIPQLVEALSSEMDPTAVCSVAGLCNNKRIDQLLLEHYNRMPVLKEYGSSCQNCTQLGNILVKKFKSSSPDDVLEVLIDACGYMGSFSDACHSLAVKYFSQIYDLLNQRLTKDALCHLSGMCYLQYHNHGDVESINSNDQSKLAVNSFEDSDLESLEIRPNGNIGLLRPIANKNEQDVPCDLCKQLVVHLRDIVIANSTEAEFKQVFKGICGEMGPLKDECDNIADNYSDVIFNVISTSLNPELVCGMINICPKGNKRRGLVMPLLQLSPTAIELSLKKKQKPSPVFTKQEIDAFQLPFDTLMGPQNAYQLVENGEVCTLCEMVLHFVQQSLAQPATEQQIKESVERTCNVLPKSVRVECDDFVRTYGDAVIAMLIQEMDPSEVCPLLKMCSQKLKEDVEMVFEDAMQVEIGSQDKPTCPLCLFAVTEAQQRIQSDKSIQNIKRTLETLCNHLPQKLNVECTDFVDSYAKMLVDMLIKDMTPQQICVQLKLCTAERDDKVPSFVWEREQEEDISE